MRTIKISKLEQHPSEEPTGFAVGFSYSANGRSGYIDTLILFEEATTDEEAVEAAKEKLKGAINNALIVFESKSPLLGQEINFEGL